MLNVLEGFDLRGMGHNTATYIHHLAESMRRAYRDRIQLLLHHPLQRPVVVDHRFTLPVREPEIARKNVGILVVS